MWEIARRSDVVLCDHETNIVVFLSRRDSFGMRFVWVVKEGAKNCKNWTLRLNRLRPVCRILKQNGSSGFHVAMFCLQVNHLYMILNTQNLILKKSSHKFHLMISSKYTPLLSTSYILLRTKDWLRQTRPRTQTTNMENVRFEVCGVYFNVFHSPDFRDF